ncbi:hypothetical protein C2S52_002182, partial [Perilla frutescens var. hirtella]
VVHKDIISQLPDDILVSIIARTPTRSAVSTSILSKRWRTLYKSASNFKLCCSDLLPRCTLAPHDSDFQLIIHRLERFLQLCSGSKIISFQLKICLTKSYANQFEQCIYSLGKLGVEELILHLSCCTRPSYLPFSCHLLSKLPSLKYLLLGTCSLLPNLKSICSSLQILHLTFVTIVPGSLECILSNCLGLHSLSIRDSHCPTKLCFHGPDLQLKTLIMEYCEGTTEIEFYASNLATFEFQNLEMVNFVFGYVPQLETIYLSFKCKNIMSYVFGKLSEDSPHLKSLTFETEGGFCQLSTRHMWMGIKTFCILRRLDLSVYCTPETNLSALTPFLESCPLLQEFHLDLRNMEYDQVDVPRKPVLFLSRLRKAEITGFCGTTNEIEFALYILKSAASLEQLRIIRCVKYYRGSGRWRTRSNTPWSGVTRERIEQRLQDQALSKTAQLIIRHET